GWRPTKLPRPCRRRLNAVVGLEAADRLGGEDRADEEDAAASQGLPEQAVGGGDDAPYAEQADDDPAGERGEAEQERRAIDALEVRFGHGGFSFSDAARHSPRRGRREPPRIRLLKAMKGLKPNSSPQRRGERGEDGQQ